MKKIIMILSFLLCSFGLFAQSLPATNTVSTVSNDASYAGFNLPTHARITAAYNSVIKVNLSSAYVYSFAVKLIDNTGSNAATVVLAGSLDNINYKAITTVPYTGVGVDTAIISIITSSPLSYKYLRFSITPTDTMWVKSIFINVLPLK
jgi:hypothetical protein